jgi:hypothetical protein
MTRHNLCALVLLTLSLLAAPGGARAAQSYDNCAGFITSIPVVISTPGTWCLKQDLATAIITGKAIDIQADNVTIDCNDFKLGGLAAGAGTATYGIYANNRINATVRHCNIRGFYFGVEFTGVGGSGHTVEDSRFDGNTYIPMLVQGDGSVVRRNRVFDSGESTIANYAYGIYTQGAVDVLDNTVSGVTARIGGNGGAVGIQTETAASRRIIGNAVRGLAKDGTGPAFGIYNSASDRLTVRDNDLVGDNDVASEGIRCNNSSGRAMDNTISGFGGAIIICNDSGGNTVIP